MTRHHLIRAYIQALRGAATPLDLDHVPVCLWRAPQVELLASYGQWYTALHRGSGRHSVYGQRLRARRVLRYLYGGLSATTLHHVLTQAASMPGLLSQNVVQLLERRLDIALWRAHWWPSPQQAAHALGQGGIQVNGHTVYTPGYMLCPGDVVSIVSHQRSRVLMDMQQRLHEYSVGSAPVTPQWSRQSSMSPVDVYKSALAHGRVVDMHSYGHGAVALMRTQVTPQQPPQGHASALGAQVYRQLLPGRDMARHLWQGVCMSLSKGPSGAMAPLHLEVSYSTLTMVYLYSPQRVLWSALVDLEML